MHVYQMRSSNQTIVSATQHRLRICMTALRDVSKVWLVAKMVHTLFESILGNKVLEERLQKAAGRKHAKSKANGTSTGQRTAKSSPPPQEFTQQATDAQKRKYDDMELGYGNGPPAPQMSYERSRPQSPAVTPGQELPHHSSVGSQAQAQQQLPQISAGSPPIRQSNTDAFMGTSRANTRPTTPFNTFSYPGTPPDLFLHTRGSPKISEDLWQNYDPGQLFPPEANGMLGGIPLFGPGDGAVDPALRAPQPQAVPQAQMAGTTPGQLPPQQTQVPIHDGQRQSLSGQPPPPQLQQQGQHMPTYHRDAQAWAQLHAMQGQQQRLPDDQWSNPSSSGPIVPTTLNVGDWFEFFGIPNGDINALSALSGAQGQAGGGGYG